MLIILYFDKIFTFIDLFHIIIGIIKKMSTFAPIFLTNKIYNYESL